jgi:hypothetical protein
MTERMSNERIARPRHNSPSIRDSGLPRPQTPARPCVHHRNRIRTLTEDEKLSGKSRGRPVGVPMRRGRMGLRKCSRSADVEAQMRRALEGTT